MPLAQNITVIPAIRKVGTQKPETKVQKTRVAAYCRVSTEYEEQESSYDVQVEHYTTYIKSKPEWEFVEVYADMYNQRLIQCPAHGSVEKRLK